MLVEYNNDVFNAELQGNKVNIWKYVPVDWFKKAQTRKGIVYYENYVSTSETSKPFSVSFFAEKNEKKYIIHSIITMARKTAANPDAYCLDLRVRLSVGCKRRYYFFLYLPDFSYFRL